MGTNEKGKVNLSKNRVLTIAIEVKDLDKTVDFYQSNFGIGPFIIQERVNDCILHGKKTQYTARWATTRLGGGQIALTLTHIIDGESIHKEILMEKGEGVSSICFDVADLDAEIVKLEKKGIGVTQYIKRKNGGAYAYMDTGKIGGMLIQLLEGGISGVPAEWGRK
jgi:4-hydroxyphenylpyruvate dioxygenase-like putative hemolysin